MLKRFLFSTPNLMGVALALLLLVSVLSGILPIQHWLLPTSLFYAAGVMLGWAFQPKTQPLRWQPELDTPSTLAWLREASPRLPTEAQTKLNHIILQAEALLPKVKSLEEEGRLDPETRHQLKQALLKHLPTSLDTYMRLPKKLAHASAHAAPTPYGLLLEQLNFLEQGLNDIEVKLYEGDLNQLQVQSQLLKEKYGPKNIVSL